MKQKHTINDDSDEKIKCLLKVSDKELLKERKG